MTPAWTVASRSSTLTRSTRFIRDRSMQTPPRRASTCPSSEVPAPKGMMGMFRAAAARTMALISSVVCRVGDDVGSRRLMVRLAVAVMVTDGWCRRHPVGKQLAKHFEQVGSDRRGTHIVQYISIGSRSCFDRRRPRPGSQKPGANRGQTLQAARGPEADFDLRRWPAVIAPDRFTVQASGSDPALSQNRLPTATADCRLPTED